MCLLSPVMTKPKVPEYFIVETRERACSLIHNSLCIKMWSKWINAKRAAKLHVTIELETQFPNHHDKELMNSHRFSHVGSVCQGGQDNLGLGLVQLDLYCISFPTEWGCDAPLKCFHGDCTHTEFVHSGFFFCFSDIFLVTLDQTELLRATDLNM